MIGYIPSSPILSGKTCEIDVSKQLHRSQDAHDETIDRSSGKINKGPGFDSHPGVAEGFRDSHAAEIKIVLADFLE